MTTEQINEWDQRLERLRRAWLDADKGNKRARLQLLKDGIKLRNKEEG